MNQAAYDRWFPPSVAIKKLGDILSEGEAQTEIHRRICEGEVLSVARTANWYQSGGVEVRDYVRLGAFLWKANPDPNWHDLLWKTGTHTLQRPDYPSTKKLPVECFGIRFDPAGIGAILIDGGVEVPQVGSMKLGPLAETRTKDISIGDAERVSRAILAGWPETTEKDAHAKALAFFPANKVPRDWFLQIFRSIRGPKSPGKTPKIRQ